MSEKRSTADVRVILAYLNEHIDRIQRERTEWEALGHGAMVKNCSLHIKVLTAHTIDLRKELDGERPDAT